MSIELYKEAALTRDVPESGLRAGDVVMPLDFVPHPEGGEEGCVFEYSNVLGESLGVDSVERSALEPLTEDEVISVRRLQT